MKTLKLAFIVVALALNIFAQSSTLTSGTMSQSEDGGKESFYVDVTFTLDSLSGFHYTKAWQMPAFDGVDWSVNPPMFFKRATSTYKSNVGLSAWLIGCYTSPTDTAAAGSGMVLDTLISVNVNETDSAATFFAGSDFSNQKTAKWYRLKLQNINGTNYGDVNSGRIVLYFPARKEK